MPRRTLYRAMIITIACVVLLSLTPATADAIGASAPRPPVPRTVSIETPRDGDEGAVRGARDMSVEYFISGTILGMLLGLLFGPHILSHMQRWWQDRQQRQRDIDRLTAQFQALFRESDQGKNHHP
jgi:hypothetical protein